MKMLKENNNEDVGALIHKKKKESDNTKNLKKMTMHERKPHMF
jgi:hypothetical protein